MFASDFQRKLQKLNKLLIAVIEIASEKIFR